MRYSLLKKFKKSVYHKRPMPSSYYQIDIFLSVHSIVSIYNLNTPEAFEICNQIIISMRSERVYSKIYTEKLYPRLHCFEQAALNRNISDSSKLILVTTPMVNVNQYFENSQKYSSIICYYKKS